MRTWSDYKKTFRTGPDVFDYARTGDLRGLADLLMSHPETDLNARNHRGFAPLMLAVYHGQRDFCEALLRAGVDADAPDFMDNTLLMAAAFKGNREILDLLVAYGADLTRKNRAGMDAMDWATAFGREEAKLFLQPLLGVRRRRGRLACWWGLVRMACGNGWRLCVEKVARRKRSE